MYRMIRNTCVSLLLSLFAVFTARADFSNTVMSLSPAGYWPLNDQVVTPQAEVASNLGTLGAAANAYYLGTNTGVIDRTISGATADGDKAALFVAGKSASLAIPRTTPNLVLRPPFSVECWVYQTNSTTGNGIVAYGRNSDLASSVYSGFALQTAANGAVTFNTYNRNSTATAVSLTTSALGLNVWHHFVATYDTNSIATLYADGTFVNSATNGYFPSFAPEIQIGSQGGLNTSLFVGSLDEVAIYTNVLSISDVGAHFNAAINGTPVYKDTVLAANPTIYLRLDEPAYTAPSPATFAVATNYGTVGATASGAYQPGTIPGVAGPPFSGFGSQNYACAFNGLNALVDCGKPNGLLPSLSATNAPISVVAWFKCNPVDFRFQSMLGRGDSGWRMAVGGATIPSPVQWNPGLGGDVSSTYGVNDGNWHMVAGIINSTNGRIIYVDGISNNIATGTGIYGTAITNLTIGGAPDYITSRGLGVTRYFAGNICQVAYFTNALTANDVSNLFNAAGIYVKVAPVSQAVVQGNSVTLSVVAQGPGSLGYQWYKGATPVGGNSSSYTIASAAVSDAGSYTVVITNATDSLTSPAATLSVQAVSPPSSTYASAVLALNPIGYWPLTESAGSAFAVNHGSLGAAASGQFQYGANAAAVAGPSYSGFGGATTAVQFHRWGGFIDLGTSLSLTPTNRSPLSVVAWFQGPLDLSRTETIAGHGDAYWRLGFDGPSSKNRFNPGNGTELAGTQNLNDGQWHQIIGVSDGITNALYLDGVLIVTNTSGAISGAVVPTNQLHAVIGGAPDYGAALNYPVTSTTTVRFWEGNIAQVAFFTNSLSAANVASLYGAAGIPPIIVSQPTSVSGGVGLTPSVSVGVLGSPALTYQWFKNNAPMSNGGNISGASAANLTFTPVSLADNASYFAIITNNYGAVTSATVTVSVYAAPTTTYATNILALNPAGYWPLTESVQPPAPYYATNLGTAGAGLNGVYETWWATNGGGANPFAISFSNTIVHVPGVTGDGDTAAVFGNNGQYVVLPHNNPKSIIISPFTVEAWVYATNAPSGLVGIVSEARNNINGAATYKGFWLGANGTTWVFALYNTNGQASQEIDVPGIVANTWYHLVGTFDGTSATLYTNGVIATASNGANPKALTANSAGLRFVADDNSPLIIGSLGNFNSGRFGGYIDEVAIYTNALTLTDVGNHFNNTASSYSTFVQANNPLIYLRLDEADGYNLQNAQGTFPIANNYGNIGANANGLYQPGIIPGIAGPTNAGFGSSLGVAINGLAGVEIGGGNLTNLAPALNRTALSPISVVAWFKGPVDNARFQNILGHSDNNWRLAVDTTGLNRFNPGGGTELTGTTRPAGDGQWHMVAAVGNGANDFLYIDGTQQATSTHLSALGDGRDLILGGDPQYTGPGTRNFLGSISQVAYFTNALTAAQIQQIYFGAGFPPVISTQPTNIIANAGGSAADSVAATGGTPPFSYQWYKGTPGSGVAVANGTQGNGTVISGATTNLLSFATLGIDGSDTGTYFVVVANSFGSVTSSVVSITVNTAPKVTQQPPSFALFTNASCTFTIAASGAAPLSYQWLSNTIAISGATNISFTLSNVLLNYAANYSCKVTNTLGNDVSSNGVLTVINPSQTYQGYVRTILGDSPSAYWRLDESAGLVAYDYVGAHNGQYTNAVLNLAGVNSLDPDTAAGFGVTFGAAASNSYAGNMAGISFPATNANATFSVEAWVRGPATQIGGAGIVSKGFSGAEQFALDYNAVNGVWRFFVRDAGVGIPSHVANATSGPDNNWHHLVGVCDEPNSNAFIYVDGVRVGSAAITTNTGVASTALPVVIGSRQSVSNGNFDFQFNGSIDEVAIYNYALSGAQVSAHYAASQRAPVITQQPATPQTIYGGARLSLSVLAGGTPTLAYQWYRGPLATGTALSNGGTVSGATSNVLTINSLALSDTNFFVKVSNGFGTATSTLAVITVLPNPTNGYPLAVIADHPIGYWRLGETNNPSEGATAFDYVGGHNGTYTATALGAAGYRPYDLDTAATFGSTTTADSHVQNIQGIDFAAPTNVNSSLSLECWVLGSSTPVTTDAGVITRGAGNSGEQFNLDLGATSHAFRFFIRRADTNTMIVNGTVGPSSTTWHHVVGVADESIGKIFLYVDGVLNNSAAGPTNAGVMTNWSGDGVSIGARRSTSLGTSYNNQFFGTIDEAAIYNYALSAAQVQNHYFASGVAPTVLIPATTTNVTVSEGNNVTFVSSSYGTPSLHYQWWDDVFNAPLPGKTNASLTLSNVTVGNNDQHGYYVVVTNAYGTAQSPSFILSVISGPPQVIDDVAPLTAVYAGRSFSLQVTVGGTPPFSYQWQHAGTNLNDGGRFSGTHTNRLTISAAQLGDAGDYQLLIHNAQGDAASSFGTVEVETLADFNGPGLGWTFNTFLTTSVGWLSPNVVTLTDGGGGEESSAWYQFPLYIGSFYATFTYQAIGGADGMAFVLHNDPRGTAAIGGTGGALGYGPDNGGTAIQPSVGLEFNIYNGHTIGYAFRTNGVTGDPYTSSTPVNFASGDPIDVTLLYVNGVVQLSLTDENTLANYGTSIDVGDLIPLVGGSDSAYVGVTAATGGVASQQTVSNFAFYPLATLSSLLTSTNTVLLYWPASIGGYSLQGKADVTGATTWQDVPGPVSVSGGYNQVTVTPGAAQFYRLKATLPP